MLKCGVIQHRNPLRRIQNIERVPYRDNIYIVEALKDGKHRIINQETGKEIKETSPTGKAVLKKLLQS